MFRLLLRCRIEVGAVAAAALVVMTLPVSAQAASGSCWGGPTKTDYRGRTFSTRTCPTWTGTAVWDAVATADNIGYLYAGNNWVVCQKRGQENFTLGGTGRNNIWLYTQGDKATRQKGWGWIPATAVSYGGNYQAIPGVPWCPDDFW